MWTQLITFLSLLLFPLNGIAATVKVFVFVFVVVFVFAFVPCMQAAQKGRAQLKGAACDFISLCRLNQSSNHPSIIQPSNRSTSLRL